jgi:hypothetical protein
MKRPTKATRAGDWFIKLLRSGRKMPGDDRGSSSVEFVLVFPLERV